jgi:hypothetical protein
MRIKINWLNFYAAMSLFTFVFQIWIRSFQCAGFENCGPSVAKAAVWATIWPVSWIVYLAPLVGVRL